MKDCRGKHFVRCKACWHAREFSLDVTGEPQQNASGLVGLGGRLFPKHWRDRKPKYSVLLSLILGEGVNHRYLYGRECNPLGSACTETTQPGFLGGFITRLCDECESASLPGCLCSTCWENGTSLT